jgi:hypothetical protein
LVFVSCAAGLKARNTMNGQRTTGGESDGTLLFTNRCLLSANCQLFFPYSTSTLVAR